MSQPSLKPAPTGTMVSTNPARNFEVLGEVPVSDPAAIAARVAAARAAQPGWQALGIDGRVTAMRRLADVFKQNREEFITRTSREMGMPLGLSTSLADGAEETFAWNLDNAAIALRPQTLFDGEGEVNELRYEPYGVMACIVAWNFPYPNFIMSATQSLLAGNTVVMKYSEEVPLFCQFLESVVAQAGLPDGVVGFVYGGPAEGTCLVDQDIDLISFTGSYATGQKLYLKAAEKFIPIVNELGGSSPGVVFADTALDDDTVADIFWKRFINSAQFCDGLKRLIVHRSRYDECVAKLADFAKARVVGDPLDMATEMGPLVAARQVEKLQAQLQDAVAKGARVVCGGQPPAGLAGAYFQPTILTNVTPDMRVWHEEVFGPVLPVVTFDTYEQAIALANDTIYGLSGYIYTADKETAARVVHDIKAGSVSTQGAHVYRPQNPFGGYKKSGMGREGGVRGFHDVAQQKTVAYRK